MSNAKFIIGETGGQIDLSISPSTPSAPSSGYVSMWTDGEDIYMVNSAGTNILVGVTGAAGTSGTSGTSGINGTSGTSGINGTSGTSGINGTSGTSGINGTSGTSGINGTSGTSGINGTSGTSGINGSSGPAGATGIGLGLNAKVIPWSGTSGWANVGGNATKTFTFAQPFANTDYVVDFYATFQDPGFIGVTGYTISNSDYTGAGILLYDKTVSSITVQMYGRATADISTYNMDGYLQAVAAGETAVSNYGNFYDTTSQPNAGATAANTVTYNTTDLSSGVSVVSNSRITIANAGVYNIQFSAQLQKNSGGDDQVDIWLSKNGTNVPNSNTTIMLHSNPGYEVAAWNFLVNAASGDYYELKWSSPDTTAQLHAAVAGTNPTRPAIPSVILSVTQVSTA
jgi:hypothetical protein